MGIVVQRKCCMPDARSVCIILRDSNHHTKGAGGGHGPDAELPLDIPMVGYHLDPASRKDVALAESRAMGRVGEVIIRTWHLNRTLRAVADTATKCARTACC
jgi:urease alpha subunit